MIVHNLAATTAARTADPAAATSSTSLPPTPLDFGAKEIRARLPDDAAARAYLTALRWPEGIACLHCGQAELPVYTIAPNPAKKVRLGLLECAVCHKQFTVTVGTFFEDLHLPLDAWLCAWYLACTTRGGLGALALQRALDLPHYQTARAMLARIRDSGYPHVVARRGAVRVALDFDEAMRACLRGKPSKALAAAASVAAPVPARAGSPLAATAMPSLRRIASAP